MLRALLVALVFATPALAQDFRLFTLGSGEVGGGYFTAANAICDRLNRADRGKLRCSPEATPGSFYNLMALRDGQLDFALVQSDWQRNAYEGTEDFAQTGAMPDLRSVMSLYPEAITVLVGRDSGITDLTGLLGKRVDIGHPASGRHATVTRLMAASGFKASDFSALLELPNGAAIDELCAGRIDATVLILGHPNAPTGHALADCGARLVALGPQVSAALDTSPDFVKTTIPMSAYPSMTSDVQTYSVIATLVTLAGTDPMEVDAVLSETLKHLPELKSSYPILTGLDPAKMRSRGLTAPLHPGAVAAFDAPGTGE